MPKRIHDTPFRDLVPDSIRDDATVRSAADAFDAILGTIVRDIPNLLVFSRIDPTPGMLLAPLQRIADAAGGLKPLSVEELELLAWQFHVDFREVAKTREQLAELVRGAMPWHRIKGTPASIRAALALFGFPDVTIEEGGVGMHWATYQIGLPEVADIETVKLVSRVAAEMAPVRCRLGRIYNGVYDMRPSVWGADPWAENWWGGYSGVSVPGMPGTDDEFVVSFGARLSMRTPPLSPRFCASGGSLVSFLAPYLDRPRWGLSAWGERFIENRPFGFGQIYSSAFGQIMREPRPWSGPWPRIPWASATTFGRALPRWELFLSGVARSRAVWSEAVKPWGDINAKYGAPTFTVFDEPAAWGESAYGEPQGEREVAIDVFEFVRTLCACPPKTHARPGGFGCSRQHGSLIPYADRPRWRQGTYGEPFVRNRPFAGASLSSSFFGDAVRGKRTWSGTWNHDAWAKYEGIRGREPRPCYGVMTSHEKTI